MSQSGQVRAFAVDDPEIAVRRRLTPRDPNGRHDVSSVPSMPYSARLGVKEGHFEGRLDASNQRAFLAGPMAKNPPDDQGTAVPVWEGVEYPRYPPGVYEVRCIKRQGPEWLKIYSRWSIRLEFSFLYEASTVSGFLNMGSDPARPRVGRHSKYFKLWCEANGGLPNRGQKMDPEIFIGKFWRVRIADSSATEKERAKTTTGHYSKITDFLAFIGP